jgi:hypothetical protein
MRVYRLFDYISVLQVTMFDGVQTAPRRLTVLPAQQQCRMALRTSNALLHTLHVYVELIISSCNVRRAPLG